MYEKTVLANGLRIVTHRMPHMRSTALGIWIATGGRYETKENNGISHFLEHLLFKGSKDRTGKQIKESIEGVGGLLNGFTSEEFTCYLIKVIAKYLPLCLDVLSDMVLNPVLSPEEVERERMVILEEIRMYLDQPSQYVGELLDQLLWPNQPLGRSLVGTIKTVSEIKRGQLCHYKERFYNPKNMVVATCGPMDHEDIVRGVKKYFLKVSPKTAPRSQKMIKAQKNPQTNLLFKETEQTHISLGTHALPRDHPDRYALSLLNVILGGSMSSRLFQELREKKGLAYEIGSHLKRYRDTGAFIVSAGVENRSALQAIELILRELKKTKKESIKRNEFERAKEFYTGQLQLALEDTMSHMLWVGEGIVTLNKVYTIDEILKEVSQIEIEDLTDVANKIFRNDSLNLAIIGPIKNRDKVRIERALEI